MANQCHDIDTLQGNTDVNIYNQQNLTSDMN